MQNYRLLLRNASQVVRVSSTNELMKIYPETGNLHVLQDASIVVNNQGQIEDVDLALHIDQKYKIEGWPFKFFFFLSKEFSKVIDCKGKVILPGFIDPHTHSCYAGDRVQEFKMKLEGATYMQIHQMGGGIYSTVKHVNQASEEELGAILESVVRRAQKMGTTLMEVKSGFGLNTEAEIKQLKVIEQVKKRVDIELVATYCGAHALPQGINEVEATQGILDKQLPAIQEEMKKGSINPEFIDVFCEKSIYELNSSQQILEAGRKIGLIPAFHGEELFHLESAKMGADINAMSISHLEHLSEEGIEAMSQKKVVGIILPTTHFLLKLKDPPVRTMIEKGKTSETNKLFPGVPTALGSDFGPNAHCMSMPLTMSLACLNLKMKPCEALCAATLNAAAALNRSKLYGSIEVGKWADLVVLNAASWEHIVYQIGDSPIERIIKKGIVIV